MMDDFTAPIDIEKVDALLEGFSRSTGFVAAILDLNGKILTKSGWRELCTDFHRVHPETSRKCTVSDTELAGELSRGKKCQFYRCLNGLVDVAVPIVINGEHIANLFSGQFFLEEPDRVFFKNQAVKYGFDEVKYLEALAKVPIVSKEKVLDIMGFLQNMTQLISEMMLQKQEQKELNKALKESEERYKALHNASFGGIIIHDKGIIIECNQGLSEISGYSYEELIGMDGLMLIAPDSRDFVFHKITSGYEKVYEAKGIRKNGEIFPLRLEARNIPFKGKNVRSVEFRDITETKKSELIIQSKTKEIELHNRRLESLLKISQYQTDSIQELLDFALDEAIILTNSKIGYIYFYDESNKQFTLNAWSKDVMEECKVMNPQTTYDLDNTGCWGEVVRQERPIVINDYDAFNKLKKGIPDGHVKLHRFLSIPVFSDNKIVAVAGVANKKNDYDHYDINQLSLLMSSVLKISERITLIRDLTRAKEKAEESDRLKSAFLANVSHEIRTPMNGIMGFAELLKDPELTDDHQRQQYISVIEKSGASMLNIVNNILSISKIESGTVDINFSYVDVNSQMHFIYDSLRLRAENKNLTFIFNCPFPDKKVILKTDNEKFNGIINNLVSNAIQYTDEGKIEFGYTIKEGQFEFYVKDTGIGIPEERRAAVFERFIQADIEDAKARQGAGLGLAISKSYVEMMGGKIWMKSEERVGSTFYFTLPDIA